MARGYLFTVAEEKDSIPNINADGMALGSESWQAEWFEDVNYSATSYRASCFNHHCPADT